MQVAQRRRFGCARDGALTAPGTHAARLAGMAVDLKLTVGERYSIITLVFFVPYSEFFLEVSLRASVLGLTTSADVVIFELPSNLIIRKVGCRNQLSTIVIAW